jgi:hypothetical protein
MFFRKRGKKMAQVFYLDTARALLHPPQWLVRAAGRKQEIQGLTEDEAREELGGYYWWPRESPVEPPTYSDPIGPFPTQRAAYDAWIVAGPCTSRGVERCP